MADTKLLESIAESRVISELTAARMLVVKPHFDRGGADLIVLSSVEPLTKIGILQVKYRSVKSDAGSSIKIPRNYVNSVFFVFLNVEDSASRQRLFFFDSAEITKWTESGDDYLLSIPYDAALEEFMVDRIFRREHCDAIRAIVDSCDNDIGLDDLICGSSKLLRDLMEHWEEHGLIPSGPQIRKIQGDGDYFWNGTPRQLAWIFVVSYLHSDELGYQMFDELFGWLTKQQNATEALLRPGIRATDIWTGISREIYWAKFIVANVAVKPTDERSCTGLYGFVRDSEGEGIEVLIPSRPGQEVRIRHIKSDATALAREALEFLEKSRNNDRSVLPLQ